MLKPAYTKTNMAQVLTEQQETGLLKEIVVTPGERIICLPADFPSRVMRILECYEQESPVTIEEQTQELDTLSEWEGMYLNDIMALIRNKVV